MRYDRHDPRPSRLRDPMDPADEPFGGWEPDGPTQTVMEQDGTIHLPLMVDLDPIEIETEHRIVSWLPWPTRTRTVKLEVPPHPERPLLDPETGEYLLPDHMRGEGEITVRYGVDWGAV